MTSPSVSVVLLVRDQMGTLPAILNTLGVQEGIPEFEILAIDSGSVDGSRDLLASTAVRLVEIRPEEFHHSRTRNLGAGLARGDLIVWLSADAVPRSRHWLASLIAPFVEPRVMGAYGRQVARAEHGPLQHFRLSYIYPEKSRIRTRADAEAGDDRAYSFSDVNACIRREFWESHRYPEDIPIGEDAAMARAIIDSGYSTAYVAEAVVEHSHNFSAKDLFTRYYALGAAFRRLGLDGTRKGPRLRGSGLDYACREFWWSLRHHGVVWAGSSLWYSLAKAGGYVLGRRHEVLPPLVRNVLAYRPRRMVGGPTGSGVSGREAGKKHRLHVGFDATQLPHHGAGTSSYILNLVKALATLPTRRFELTVVMKDVDQHLFEGLARIEVVPVAFRGRPHRLIWEQMSLSRLLSRHGVGLLHSPHYTVPLSTDLARVVTFHDLTYMLMPEKHSRSRRWFFRWMIPRAAELADRIICDSSRTKADLHRLYPELSATKSTVVPAGVDARYYCPLPTAIIEQTLAKYDLSEGYVLHVGTIEPRKNLETALGAVEILRQGGVSTMLVLAGPRGWISNDVMSRLSNSTDCRVLGHVPFEDLRALYAGAGAVIIPSHYEGFGLPAVEAMAAGVPVVCSGKGSLREVSGPAAVIPHNDSPLAYADALRTALRRGPTRDALIQAGKEWARQFSWERSAALVARAYDEVWENYLVRRQPVPRQRAKHPSGLD